MDLPRAFAAVSQASGVPLPVLIAVAKQESGFRADAKSPVGAYGMMQLMDSTAQGLGVNSRDPLQNLAGGAAYLKQQIHRFGLEGGIAAFNAGPGAVEKYGGKVPPYKETTEYVRNIMATINSLGQ